jgi:hypothetical protein
MVKAVFPVSQADDGEKPEDIPQEKADAAYQQDGKDEGFWRSQGNSFMRVSRFARWPGSRLITKLNHEDHEEKQGDHEVSGAFQLFGDNQTVGIRS